MSKLALIIFLSAGCLWLSGQNNILNDPFYKGKVPTDSVFWSKVTVEQMLCLPQGYFVKSCDIRFVSKGEIFFVGYRQGVKQSCLGTFDAIRRFSRYAHPGDKLLISDILVRKDEREIKLAGKAIVF